MSRYSIVLLLSLAIPLVVSFWPPLRFYRNKGALFLSISIIVIIFGAWDVFAAWRGHWHFGPDMVWFLRLVNLPLEEWLFFVVIPFCCIFTWEAVKYLRLKVK